MTAPAAALPDVETELAQPTLGWAVLAHTFENLRSPRDDSQPFVFTEEQATHVLRMYAVDDQGRRLYRRVHEEQAKGWGKSPLAAAIALMELSGPVCFGGWGDNGQPLGIPWGSPGLPVPWVQVAAVSEDQTANTHNALYALLMADHGRVAERLHIEPGITQARRTDLPGAYLERVTASAGSREGQPVTFAVLDEPQLWTPSNQGIRLAHTIMRNTAKMNGWGLFTGNAPILGEGSVAEVFRDPAPGVLHMGNRPSVEPQEDWPADRLRDALREVYGEAWWMDHDRLLAELADPAQPWADKRRFFFNLPGAGKGGDAYLAAADWDACADDAQLSPREPTYASVRLARDLRSAAVAVAQLHGDRVVLRCSVFETPDLEDGEMLDLAAVEAHLVGLTSQYPAKVLAPVTYHPGGKVHLVPRTGPEVTYHGSFFQRSRQLLQGRVVLVEQPDSGARLAPAAAQLRGLVFEGKLSHDGDPDLARHMGDVVVREIQAGPMPQQPTDPRQRIEAALAVMHATHRAMTAPRPPGRRMRGPA